MGGCFWWKYPDAPISKPDRSDSDRYKGEFAANKRHGLGKMVPRTPRVKGEGSQIHAKILEFLLSHGPLKPSKPMET